MNTTTKQTHTTTVITKKCKNQIKVFGITALTFLIFLLPHLEAEAAIIFDPFGDDVQGSSGVGITTPQNVLGAPDQQSATLLGINSTITINLGVNEEGGGDLRLHYGGPVGADIDVEIDFLDKNFSVIKSEERTLTGGTGQSVETISYSFTAQGNRVYRFVRVTSLVDILWSLDAVETLDYVGEDENTDMDEDGIPDRKEISDGTDPLDPNDPGELLEELSVSPPTVIITSPASGSRVSGTVTFFADAFDDLGISFVQFKYNNINLGPPDTVIPFAVSWDTTQVPDGAYSITAVARDIGDLISENSSPSPWSLFGTLFGYNFGEIFAPFKAFAAEENETTSEPVTVIVDNEDDAEPTPPDNDDNDTSSTVNVTVNNLPPEESSGSSSSSSSSSNEKIARGTRSEIANSSSERNAPVEKVSEESEESEEGHAATTEKRGCDITCWLLVVVIALIVIFWLDYHFSFFLRVRRKKHEFRTRGMRNDEESEDS